MLRRWTREPLVHFLGIGLLLFVLYGIVSPADTGGERIVVSASAVQDMQAQYERLWGRPPTADELRHVIDSRVEEEILYREGLTMGLDRDDAVVKRRVRQKYELIAEEEDGAAPTDADLQAYLDAHPAQFTSPPVVTFTQVLLPGDGERAAAIKGALERGANPATAGQSTLLPTQVADEALDRVAKDFGLVFADTLATLPEGSWQGPVTSGFGQHLVRIERRAPASLSPLADIRPQVQREWENERRGKAREARLAQLRSRYEVVIEGRE